jgi:two-component system sensor histidine kinase UhpB
LGNLPDFETTGSTAECRGWTSINMRADTERKASPTRPVFDLKRSLMWQLAAVTLLCLLGGVTFAVYRAHEEVVQVNRSLGDAVAKYLEVPFLLTSPKLFTDVSVEELFREAADVFAATMSPGQCLRYLNESGKSVSHCLGFNERGRKAPEWFSSLHRHIIGQLLTYERPVMRRGTMRGRILVLTAPEVVTARAWSDISQLLGLSAATIAALCILVYFVIERALRPAGDIVGALHQLALGNLRCRLPPFRLSELRIISDVFNQVAAALDVAISERSNLARRLVDAREQERRHLARELHDELAQSLSAMRAAAASIKIAASNDCPSLLPEAQALTITADNIMQELRKILQELRLQEIDDLGLRASLEGLIEKHNRAACGKTWFSLKTQGDVDALPTMMAVHIFHIVQEGLTNTIKHAEATNVGAGVRVTFSQEVTPGLAGGMVEVTIEDDGAG